MWEGINNGKTWLVFLDFDCGLGRSKYTFRHLESGMG